MKKDDIEDLFKKSFEDFEADVNPGVWKNIQTGLKGAGLGIFGKILLNKIGTSALVAVVSSGVAVVTTVVVMNWTGKPADRSNVPAANTGVEKSLKVVNTPKPAKVSEIKDFLSPIERERLILTA